MSTPRFLYHASAVGLAGEIRRPFQHNIDAQAATALPRYGGHAAGQLKSFELGGVVAHSGVSTEVTGVYQPHTNSFETNVRSTVNGFNLEGVLTCQLLTSSIHSSHPAEPDKPGEPPVEPSISVAGSEIRGLVIAGREIVLEPRLDFYSKFVTMTGLREYYKENAGFREDFERSAYVGQEAALPEDVRHYFPWRRHKTSSKLHEYNQMTIVPLYTVKNPSEPGFEVYGNVIRVKNFGRIHLGELIIEPKRRRLLMMRADMGSPCEGGTCAGCSDGNGSVTPPPDGGGGNGD
jgi:hypothetical protein